MEQEIELFKAAVRQVEQIEVTYYDHRQLFDGEQFEIRFDNGFGASVIRHSGSYGGREGLFELMVISAPTGWDANYTTELMTVDPIGWLTETEVIDMLKDIAKL